MRSTCTVLLASLLGSIGGCIVGFWPSGIAGKAFANPQFDAFTTFFVGHSVVGAVLVVKLCGFSFQSRWMFLAFLFPGLMGAAVAFTVPNPEPGLRGTALALMIALLLLLIYRHGGRLLHRRRRMQN